MPRPTDPKSQYVDISYGWQNREEAKRLQEWRRRFRWLTVAGLVLLAMLWLAVHWLG